MEMWLDINDSGLPHDSVQIKDGPMTLFRTDERLRDYNLPQMVQFGFGSPQQVGAPTGGPDGSSTAELLGFDSVSNRHLDNGEYVIALSKRGRFLDLDGNLSHAYIYISNVYGQFAALEILSGGVVLNWGYNASGDNKWAQR